MGIGVLVGSGVSVAIAVGVFVEVGVGVLVEVEVGVGVSVGRGWNGVAETVCLIWSSCSKETVLVAIPKADTFKPDRPEYSQDTLPISATSMLSRSIRMMNRKVLRVFCATINSEKVRDL